VAIAAGVPMMKRQDGMSEWPDALVDDLSTGRLDNLADVPMPTGRD